MSKLTLTIYGKVPAKSSSRKLIYNYKLGRQMIVSSDEVEQYEIDFEKQITSKYKNKFNPDSRLDVSIIWYTDSNRQDIDSPSKCIFDCLQKCEVIKNDNRIDEFYIVRGIDKLNPRIIITIEEIQ